MARLPLFFSGMAVLLGVLMLLKFKESRLVALLFYLSLFGSGLSRMLLFLAEDRPVNIVDIGIMIIFGTAAIGNLLLILRERRERIEGS
jgi:lipid-A-disaccharide synthase-like uncharacterized protein